MNSEFAKGATDAPECRQCVEASNNPLSGQYSFRCLQCCTRLVRSTYPNKQRAAAMLAAIARHIDAPARTEILENLKR